jgi:hypothetical protein
MPSEKQNNITSRLDGLDRLPEGFAFDQDLSWQGFEKEFYSKKARRKKAWLIAAVLVPAFAISYFFTNSASDPHPGISVKDTLVRIPAFDPIPVQQVITFRRNKEVTKMKKSVARIPMIKTKTLDTVKTVVFMDTTQTSKALNEITTATVVVQPKPKFRIAHINEINSDPAVSPGALTSPILKKPFLATVSTVPADDANKIVQKKKFPLSFLSNPMQ